MFLRPDPHSGGVGRGRERLPLTRFDCNFVIYIDFANTYATKLGIFKCRFNEGYFNNVLWTSSLDK